MKKNSFSHQLCVSLKMINDIMILPSIRELEIHATLQLCPRPLRAPPAPQKTRAAEPARSPCGEDVGPPDLGWGHHSWGAVPGVPQRSRHLPTQCTELCEASALRVCVTGLQPGLLPTLLGGSLSLPSPDAGPPAHLERLLLSLAWCRWCPRASSCRSGADRRNPWIAILRRVRVWGE